MPRNQRVRVLLGTRKGTYVVDSDRRRRTWRVGPAAHAGSEVYHVVADPRHPGDLYAAVNNGFWGPMVQRSRNWGKTWKEIATPLTPVRKDRTGPFFDDSPGAGTPRPLTNLWHIEPGLPSEPGTLFLGADPHLLFRSPDLGASWQGVASLNEHPDRKNWGPGAGGACLHTILLDPRDPQRLYVGMSAVGTFRSEDGGGSWKPVNRGVMTPFLPTKYPETGQCVHHVAMDAANPDVFYRQDHGGMYVSRDRMERWTRIGRALGDDFGFCVASPASAPGRAYFVRLNGQARVTGEGYFQVHAWDDERRRWSRLLQPGAFPGHFGVQREGIATDALTPHGIYVGTTTGQLFISPNAGRSWQLVAYQFPGIHSVSIANPD
ncbi:MAG TPA: exo-alpha-sialidase [Thermoplasmata archaeon]|nr:exo-alpha-sialidase [Thermoplasmata archaeon]